MTSWLGKSLFFLRIGFSGAFLVGASYFTVRYLEENLTSLIIESTVEALKDPEVHQDVYNLFTKLLTRLLEDPVSKVKITEFLQKTMNEPVFENSTIELAVKILRSEGVKEQASGIMRQSSIYIVKDPELKEKIHDLSSEVVSAVRLGDKLRKLYHLKYSDIQLIRHTQIEFPTKEYNNTISDNLKTIQAANTQYKITQAADSYAKSITLPIIPSIQAPELATIRVLDDIHSATSPFLPIYYENKINRVGQISFTPPQPASLKPPELKTYRVLDDIESATNQFLPLYYENKIKKAGQISFTPPATPSINPAELTKFNLLEDKDSSSSAYFPLYFENAPNTQSIESQNIQDSDQIQLEASPYLPHIYENILNKSAQSPNPEFEAPKLTTKKPIINRSKPQSPIEEVHSKDLDRVTKQYIAF